MSDSDYTILIAEEDGACRQFLADNLAADGYKTLVACSREQVLSLLCERLPHLVVLDINGRTLGLIDAVRDGRGVASRVNRDVPILVLSGQAKELERVRLLRRGADDVVAKPFSYPELSMRIAGLLRRAYRPARRAVLLAGPVTIDLASHTVDIAETPVELSRLEFDLLRTLAAEPERVFTKQELLRDVWGYRSPARTRTIDSHCSRLRRKLSDGGAPALVQNVWGVGVRLMDPSPVRSAA